MLESTDDGDLFAVAERSPVRAQIHVKIQPLAELSGPCRTVFFAQGCGKTQDLFGCHTGIERSLGGQIACTG